MITKDAALSKKGTMERLALIKERYQKLIMRQRQEIEKELQDDFKQEEEFDPALEVAMDHDESLESE